MSLATLTAILAVSLLGLSLVQRRTTRFDPTLSWVIRGLSITILILVAFYAYGRFVA